MILIQHIKAALVLNTDLKEKQILNGRKWTGLNSTLSRCTWEAPWTQNKVQMTSKPGRTFSLMRRTFIVHRCFLDNSVKKTTHTSEQSMESTQDTSLPLLFLFNQFQIRRNYPKEEKLSSIAVWTDMCNTSASTCQPCFSCHASPALWLTQSSCSKSSCPASCTQSWGHAGSQCSCCTQLCLAYCAQLHHQPQRERGRDYQHLRGRKKVMGSSRVFSLLNQKWWNCAMLFFKWQNICSTI